MHGIAFPTAADGSQSSTRAGAQILAAALGAMAPALARAALGETRWRRAYPRYFRLLVEHGLASTEQALRSAEAGLDAAWQTLCWAGPQGPIPLADALRAEHPPLQGRRLKGQGEAAPAPWTVPLNGQSLSGAALRANIGDWQDRGIIEASAADALRRCLVHPEWFDLSDRHLVLLGAGSEAGPLRWLMRWRANVVAVDIARPAVWARIAEAARAGNGTLTFPLRDPAAAGADEAAALQAAGADLITDTSATAAWLSAMPQKLDIGALAYQDGERHVRVSMGMNMVCDAVCKAKPDTGLAFLATPTDVFAVARETARAAMSAYAARSVASRTFQGSLHLASGERFFQPNVEGLIANANGLEYGVVDSLVIEQGPNYALAKRLQQWRALRARAAGHRVSLNVAPSTTTVSVIKNPALAAGFAGASALGVEVFEPATTNALMAALWVHDLRSSISAADPHRPLAHPYELFMDNACHGGLWRAAYVPRSALPFAAALGWVRQKTRV